MTAGRRRSRGLPPWHGRVVGRLAAVAALALCFGATAAFHDGGAGRCSACHVMHSEPAGGATSDWLLREGNATDVCLTCHESRHGNSWGESDDPLAPGPVYGGGPFVFLIEDNLNDAPGGTLAPIPGHAAGHSIISPDKGLGPDPVNGVAPGGSYPSAMLQCTSCHDPHGAGGSFRLLYGSERTQSRAGGYLYDFVHPAPDAQGIGLGGPGEADGRHSAYRSGSAAWCSNCHGDFHAEVFGGFEHPGDHELEVSEAAQYNAYAGTGQPSVAEPYLALVPFEDPALSTGYTGPASAGSSRVTCLSCHRAHASSAPDAGRWDFQIETWAEEGVESGSYPIPNPYPAAGPAQEELCRKCHENEPS